MFKDDFFKGEPLCKIGDCEFWGKQLITPEIAEEILLTNGKNRPISVIRYSSYARMMGEGRWRNTADGITLSFDKEGNLANGQHRLHAIIRSRIAIEMFICKNGETMAGAISLPFDTGYSRSTANLTGYTKNFEAPIKYFLRYFANQHPVTADQVEYFVKTLTVEERDFFDVLSKISYNGFTAPGKAGCFFYFVKNGRKEEVLRLAKAATSMGSLSEQEAKIKNFFDTHKPISRTADVNRLNEFAYCYALFGGRRVTDTLKKELEDQAKLWIVGRY